MDLKNKISPVNLSFNFYESPQSKIGVNKPPIIFIHGVMSTPNCWNKVRNKICDKTGRKAYAIGFRNHGSSGWTQELSENHLVADLENFMLKENIAKAILVAHSLGARAAIALALEKPEMVEKLVVEDMVLTIGEEQREAIRRFTMILKMAANSLKQYPPSLPEAVAQKKLQQLFCLPWSKKPNGKISSRPITPRLPFHKEKSGKFVWDVNIDVIREAFEKPSTLDLRLTDAPVYPGEALFVSGEYSKFDVIEDEQVILKHFPKAKISVLKGVHHNYHAEMPEEYINEVSSFIGA